MTADMTDVATAGDGSMPSPHPLDPLGADEPEIGATNEDAVPIAQHEIGIDALWHFPGRSVGRHRMTVDVPHRAEFAIESLAGIVEHPVIRRMVALDARQHVSRAELPVVDRHAGLGVPPHQADPRHGPRLQEFR